MSEQTQSKMIVTLPVDNLGERVRVEIEAYSDSETWERHKLTEKAEQETVRAVAECVAAAK